MKVIKCINNNVAVCMDSNGNEVIAFGKGIGFKKPPFEIALKDIEKTYWDLDDIYISMINDIPSEIIEISDHVVNFSRSKIHGIINSNIIFSLADHINFAIKRFNENLDIKLPIINDVKHLFPEEMSIGLYALSIIYSKTNVKLPDEEAAYIALHIINSEFLTKENYIEKNDSKLIREATDIIEIQFNIRLDKESINYSRFCSHMQYLVKRSENKEIFNSENDTLYDSIIMSYPDAYKCIQTINAYIEKNMGWNLEEEEEIYLILHINRLLARDLSNN